jgi:isopentenyl phosphate kinase
MPRRLAGIRHGVGGSAAADVTGGMEAKVREMLELVEENPGLSIRIFSGNQPGNLVRALQGENLGTEISL